jgi:hypothetical protein
MITGNHQPQGIYDFKVNNTRKKNVQGVFIVMKNDIE